MINLYFFMILILASCTSYQAKYEYDRYTNYLYTFGDPNVQTVTRRWDGYEAIWFVTLEDGYEMSLVTTFNKEMLRWYFSSTNIQYSNFGEALKREWDARLE